MESDVNHANVEDMKTIKSMIRDFMPSLLGFFLVVLTTFLISFINNTYSNQPEKAVLFVGLFFLILVAFPPALYLFFRRREIDPGKLALIVLITISLLLVSIYIYRVSFYLFFPSDILLWSESDFVNDILKFRLDYPIYSAQENNESNIYTPGSQLLTYLLARILGRATSIPLWRAIQVVYVFLASVVAVSSCRIIVDMNLPEGRFRYRSLWYTLWLFIFFLLSTNTLTNPYTHTLHNDALALLISAVAYWLILKYIATHESRILFLMAVVPGIGFLVKQPLAIWAPIYCFFLIIFDRPQSIVRLITFAAVSFGCIAAAIAGCYFIWGEHFIYWTFTVMGTHQRSLLRAFQHLMDVWAYLVAGFFGGIILVRGRNFIRLFSAWLVWLLLFIIECYTSGVAWMLNHMGPGSLIAGMWFFASLVRIWSTNFSTTSMRLKPQIIMRNGIIVIIVSCFLSGLGFVRIPIKPLSEDAHRYVKEIEMEFEGQAPDKVLLDVGTWIYLKENVIMKDRGIPFGDRGYSGVGDFSGMVKRLKEKRYSKILVRHLDEPDFIYDYWMWSRSSNIRRALLENYHVSGRIKAVSREVYEESPYYFFDQISILVPNTD